MTIYFNDNESKYFKTSTVIPAEGITIENAEAIEIAASFWYDALYMSEDDAFVFLFDTPDFSDRDEDNEYDYRLLGSLRVGEEFKTSVSSNGDYNFVETATVADGNEENVTISVHREYWTVFGDGDNDSERDFQIVANLKNHAVVVTEGCC